jgi:hypothetical protein
LTITGAIRFPIPRTGRIDVAPTTLVAWALG